MIISSTYSISAIYIRLQAVHVMDVAAAIVAAVKDDGTSMGKTYDLGGPDIFSVKDLVCFLLSELCLLCFIQRQKMNVHCIA